MPHTERLVSEFLASVNGAAEGAAARHAYRDGFDRLRAGLDLYPLQSRRPSVVFESAAATARDLAASCLPLGLAVSMHLYPLCVLHCMPLPVLSLARFQRAMLLRVIKSRSLLLANAGSDRTGGPHACPIARQDGADLRVDGTFEYVSLATVADLVLFKARLQDSDRVILCAATLRDDNVQIGEWKFSGSMRLSDTSSVTLTDHRVPHGRFTLTEDDDLLRCTSDYQRSWFHLFLADVYLARLERLHDVWDLPRSTEHLVSLNELRQLRHYALRLLDDFSSGSGIGPLKQATSAIKLRVSLMSRSTVVSLRAEEERRGAAAHQLRVDASELRYIGAQPTADEVILRSIA